MREIQADAACLNFVSFTPDGTLMATASCDKAVKLWDTTTWEPIGEPLVHPHEVQTCCFSADGRLLATGTDDQDAKARQEHPADFCVWDVATRSLLAHLPAQRSGLITMVYSEPLKQFLASNARGSVERCDVSIETPRLLNPLEVTNPRTDEHNLFAIALAPDRLRVAVTTPDVGVVDLWDLRSEQVEHLSFGRRLSYGAVAFLPDGNRLLTVAASGEVVGWNLAARLIELTGCHCPTGPPSFLSCSADGNQLASSDAAGYVYRHHVGPPFTWQSRLVHLPDAHFYHVELCDDQKLLWGRDRKTNRSTFWSAHGRYALGDGPLAELSLGGIRPSADACGFVTEESNGGVKTHLVNLIDGNVAAIEMPPVYTAPDFSPDGRLAAGYDESTLYVFDGHTGKTLHRIENAVSFEHKTRPWICFRHDAKGLVIVQESGCRSLDLLRRVSRFRSRSSSHASRLTSAPFQPAAPGHCGLFRADSGCAAGNAGGIRWSRVCR